ncbi:cytochrome c oxidase accessory protein CcoG [Aureimonas fodinaquatilis]|uniref:Cytochrome c oxidase accessory protein CcoG n=1 Tax=Aureimonas fodinaquatilis TaxID=2565783 RepID=A0A5B0E0I5_9HYPH|nr:cytochrome c oxidase accessory protein CcoG [Aureimonas fodinaquatilis]KAA0971802.1 cytochrome c oxidase accessory protein CcoG [Aureimonas fodinaquatilis]
MAGDIETDNDALYIARKKIYPSAVQGYYRRLKWILLFLCLGFYWIAPWIRWDRGPNAPDQAILLDLAHRRFYMFAIEIWPQEFYYVAGLLIMAGLGLFLVTSIAGRAWCGYACPQTVWTDLFMAVERYVEGDRNARIKLDAAPWSATKLRKRLTVWTLWLLIAASTGGAWVFYFADAPTLLVDLFTLQAAPVAYFTVAFLTGTTFWLAGFMREQVCTYMCPWPRIQGAMLDDRSLIVTYHDWRGEPRSRHAKKAAASGADVGDCVDCNACVAVCPVGIDIRDGQQLECITCALCIDACDNVMGKIGKPLGLIAYSNLRDYEDSTVLAAETGRANATRMHKRQSLATLFRPRTVLYSALLGVIGLGMLYALLTRQSIDMSVLPDRAPLYVTLSDGSVRNGFTLKLLNKALESREFRISLDGIDDAGMWLADNRSEPARELTVRVQADSVSNVRVFLLRPEQHALPADFSFAVQDLKSGETTRVAAHFEAKASQ